MSRAVDSLLGERVRQYRLTVVDGRAAAEEVRVFGETSGPGRLKVVESIAVDAPNDRLMIAEELEGESMIKVYSLDGRYSGEVIDSTFFPNQAEGIVLYECGADGGYWIATDQGETVNTFHLFDRRTFAHVGSFRAPTVLNTDGIAITQRASPASPAARSTQSTMTATSPRSPGRRSRIHSACARIAETERGPARRSAGRQADPGVTE